MGAGDDHVHHIRPGVSSRSDADGGMVCRKLANYASAGTIPAVYVFGMLGGIWMRHVTSLAFLCHHIHCRRGMEADNRKQSPEEELMKCRFPVETHTFFTLAFASACVRYLVLSKPVE